MIGLTHPSKSSEQHSALNARLAQAETAERQRAVRALLQRPLICAQGARVAEFGLIRRHSEWLRDWFARNLEWKLQVDGESARLRKTPGDLTDATRPARDAKSTAPFTRRRYAILCLSLAVLERSDRQTTLGRIAEETAAITRSDPKLNATDVAIDLANFDHRRDFVQVMRLLIDLHVLIHVDGDERHYLHRKGDVLYTVNRSALAAMLNVRRGPSTIMGDTLDAKIAEMVNEPIPDTDDARNRQIRTRLLRMLIDDPVIYFDDLTDEERAYLHSQRGRLIREIELATGLTAEVRREGIAMVDERGDASDLALPEEGTDGHVTLLVAEYLAQHDRDNRKLPISTSALHRHVAHLIQVHRSHWRKAVLEAGAEITLTASTLRRLVALRLVRITPEGILPMPAIARYALGELDVESDDHLNNERYLWEAH